MPVQYKIVLKGMLVGISFKHLWTLYDLCFNLLSMGVTYFSGKALSDQLIRLDVLTVIWQDLGSIMNAYSLWDIALWLFY